MISTEISITSEPSPENPSWNTSNEFILCFSASGFPVTNVLGIEEEITGYDDTSLTAIQYFVLETTGLGSGCEWVILAVHTVADIFGQAAVPGP